MRRVRRYVIWMVVASGPSLGALPPRCYKGRRYVLLQRRSASAAALAHAHAHTSTLMRTHLISPFLSLSRCSAQLPPPPMSADMTLVIKRGLLCKREPSFFGGTTWVQQHVYVTRTGWMHLFQNNTIASSGAAQGLPLPGAQPQLSIRLDGCSLKVERRSDPSAVEADAALLTKAAAEAAKAKEEAKVKEGGEEAVEEVAALEETVVEVAPAAKVAADEFMEEIASQVTHSAAAAALPSRL